MSEFRTWLVKLNFVLKVLLQGIQSNRPLLLHGGGLDPAVMTLKKSQADLCNKTFLFSKFICEITLEMNKIDGEGKSGRTCTNLQIKSMVYVKFTIPTEPAWELRNRPPVASVVSGLHAP